MKKSREVVKIINLIGVWSGCIGFLVMFITFMGVYFGKWDTIIPDINKYGEANLEFVLLLTMLPFVIYSARWSFLETVR